MDLPSPSTLSSLSNTKRRGEEACVSWATAILGAGSLILNSGIPCAVVAVQRREMCVCTWLSFDPAVENKRVGLPLSLIKDVCVPKQA